jgi:hypothetical protein
MSDSSLSIKDASGRQFSLLNDVSPSKQEQKPVLKTNTTTKRKYHCIAPGCNKSFTTRYCYYNYRKYVSSKINLTSFYAVVTWQDIIAFIQEKRISIVFILVAPVDSLAKTI